MTSHLVTQNKIITLKINQILKCLPFIQMCSSNLFTENRKEENDRPKPSNKFVIIDIGNKSK